MIEKVLFVLLGVLLSGLGFLIKRRVEGKPKQEALDIQKKVLEIHKQMNEQGLDIDSLKTFENNLIGKNAAIQRHSTELQAETTPLIDESENRNLSQIELTQRASDKLEKAKRLMQEAIAGIDARVGDEESQALMHSPFGFSFLKRSYFLIIL